MIRTLIALTGLTTLALVAPAFAEQTTVSLTGKSPAAAYATITKAAHNVCSLEHGADVYSVYLADNCVKSTIATTLARVADPALSQYARNREAMLLTLASN